MLLLGLIVEATSKTTLPAYVTTHFLNPLGMHQTYYEIPESQYEHCTANEFSVSKSALGRPQPIRGVVHDEKAYLLRSSGAGHAGVFSTIGDMKRLCDMLAAKGKYNGTSVLQESTFDLALVDYNSQLTGEPTEPPKTASHGLGFELNQPWYMGEMTEFDCFGHTGFTGTSIIITREITSFLIILTNRTHPTRETGQVNKLREECATVFKKFLRHK
jgi:serine-type D-Ala-D-Ala carboxypeptidase